MANTSNQLSSAVSNASVSRAAILSILATLKQLEAKGHTIDDAIRLIQQSNL